ncbi:opine metallophore biosynthesis dehydrogenase [Bacillus sp. OVS6]|nr:opine metallophore biosynthesis dehydrogenase [Bacillus sp. OVS6]
MCTPSDSYVEVLNQLFSRKLTRLNKIIFLSPGIGSNILIGRHFKEELKEIELISMSAYYGATKYEEDGINVRTKALKKRIYLASSNKKSGHIHSVSKFIESLRVEARIVSAPIEAESRNVTTYVHPPFFMNSFAMKQILTKNQSLKSMYKLYPEGPITQHSIRVMVKLWKEISKVVEYFGAKPVNLLQFLNDDNYPVHNETLSREDIEQFQTFSEVKQEYLLYIRYSAILIDPFSRPDEYGRYFDFSAVPFKQAERDTRGRWAIPRIPLEDYRKLKGIYELGQAAGIEMPHALALIETFVAEVNGFAEKTQAEYSNFDRKIESRLFSGHGRREL